MSSEENKALVRRFFEEVFNEKRLDRADAFVALDYLDHAAGPGQGPGLEGAKQQRWARYFAPICTRRLTTWWPRGTRSRCASWSKAPTGKYFRISDYCIYRLVEAKVVENWEQADMLGLMQQLSVIPAPGHGGS